jgi:deazaflavin-dependent oxidoreductase (nitroreductase family)
MMRLTTLGRRSGQPRVAIVDYYDDGPNLVTVAMDGWADAQPSWWLNLQTHPDTRRSLLIQPLLLAKEQAVRAGNDEVSVQER